MSADIKRLLGIGQGTLADKEREHMTRRVMAVAHKPKVEMKLFGGVWHITDGNDWREATINEILANPDLACVTILDNDDEPDW